MELQILKEKMRGLPSNEDKFLLLRREACSDVDSRHGRMRRSLSVDGLQRRLGPKDAIMKRKFDQFNIEPMPWPYARGLTRKEVATRFKQLVEARAIAGAQMKYKLMKKIKKVKEDNALMRTRIERKMEMIEKGRRRIGELVALRHRVEKEEEMMVRKLQDSKMRLLNMRVKVLWCGEVEVWPETIN